MSQQRMKKFLLYPLILHSEKLQLWKRRTKPVGRTSERRNLDLSNFVFCCSFCNYSHHKSFPNRFGQMPQKGASLEIKFKGPFEVLRKTAKGYQGETMKFSKKFFMRRLLMLRLNWKKLCLLIAVTAATAPLLGLLGTVTGMIDIFRQITNFANPENSELARGISEALVTTKFGLVTAIPALIAHALLTRRLHGIISKLEGFSAAWLD